MKTCTKCRQDKAIGQFAIDRAKRDGRDSWCRPCRNQARLQRYYDKHDYEKQRSIAHYRVHAAEKIAYQRSYYQDHRDELTAAERARYHGDAAYRDKKKTRRQESYDPAKERATYMRRHGGINEWNRLWEAQGGCCYLCGQTLDGVPQKLIAVDHDHECHPSTRGRTESCGACRRGLTHAWCNQLIGLAGEDMDMLRAIIANFERVNAQTKDRIAARVHDQAVLITCAADRAQEVVPSADVASQSVSATLS